MLFKATVILVFTFLRGYKG